MKYKLGRLHSRVVLFIAHITDKLYMTAAVDILNVFFNIFTTNFDFLDLQNYLQI